MAWIKKIVALSAVTLMTTNCAMYRLEELRHTTPIGTPFQNELSRLYMDFATKQEKNYDWANSWHFADKGLMLAYGKDVPPEDLNDWSIPDDVRPEMDNARARLVQALSSDLMRASPSRAADAQFYFDCWVRYQDANWQPDNIAYCKDNLVKALEDIGSPHTVSFAKVEPVAQAEIKSKIPFKAAKPPTKTSPRKQKEPVQESYSFAVFFETGKPEVSEQGKNVISEVVKSVKNSSNYEVILHSSLDNTRSKEDGDLTSHRIQVVRSLLTAGGIRESAIKNSDDGTEPAGTTASRRVELFLNE